MTRCRTAGRRDRPFHQYRSERLLPKDRGLARQQERRLSSACGCRLVHGTSANPCAASREWNVGIGAGVSVAVGHVASRGDPTRASRRITWQLSDYHADPRVSASLVASQGASGRPAYGRRRRYHVLPPRRKCPGHRCRRSPRRHPVEGRSSMRVERSRMRAWLLVVTMRTSSMRLCASAARRAVLRSSRHLRDRTGVLYSACIERSPVRRIAHGCGRTTPVQGSWSPQFARQTRFIHRTRVPRDRPRRVIVSRRGVPTSREAHTARASKKCTARGEDRAHSAAVERRLSRSLRRCRSRARSGRRVSAVGRDARRGRATKRGAAELVGATPPP